MDDWLESNKSYIYCLKSPLRFKTTIAQAEKRSIVVALDQQLQSSSALEAKTSVAKALKELSHKQLSGQLTIRSFNSYSSGWRIYIGRGQIHYATSLIAQKERISYLLSRFFPDLNHHCPDPLNNEYEYLYSFFRSGQLTFQQLRDLVYTLSQEALMHCLASPPAKLEFEPRIGLDPLLVSASPKDMAYAIRPQILQWIKLRESIRSPLWRVGTENLNQFYETLTRDPSLSNLKPLAMPLTGFPNLYELARDFRMDVLTLAQKLQPYAKNRQLQVKPYEQTQIHSDAPTVACIDDSDSVQRNVKRVLETAGYQVVSLTEPARALTTLVRKKPVLILMDITMPEMNGYDLSRMLRQSASLKEVPIVMLTGRDGVVDRLRARMVGANDYITKPFNPHQLIQLVQQLTRQPQAVLK